MKRRHVTFLLAGLIAGLICVAPGSSLLGILTVTYGAGPAFFVAVVAGVLITGAWRPLQAGLLRYSAGLVLCTITYLLALIAFFAVIGFSPDLLGLRPSANIDAFGTDVWLGLIAAGAVAAGGIAAFNALLTGEWSNFLLHRLMWAGLATLIITFIVNLALSKYGPFIVVLLPLGNSLFCWAVGAQIWYHLEIKRQVSTTTT